MVSITTTRTTSERSEGHWREAVLKQRSSDIFFPKKNTRFGGIVDLIAYSPGTLNNSDKPMPERPAWFARLKKLVDFNLLTLGR